MSLEITCSKPRMVLDAPSYFPNVIKLRNGEMFVQLMWGNDRRPVKEEYEEFYAFDGPTTAQDWIDFNNKRRELHGMGYVHVLSSRWAYSADGGKTFTETGLPPVIEYAQLDNGDVITLQWYTYHDKNGALAVRSWRSHDNCHSWDAPYDIPITCPPLGDELLVAHRRIVPLGGDVFLVLFYLRLQGDTHDRSMVFITRDGFKTLSYYSTCGMWHEGIENPCGLNETDMARTADGRLLCVMRNQSYCSMYQTHSCDDGATWTPLRQFPDRGVDPALCVLSNGVTVCSYGRPGVQLIFSENGGDNWEKRTSILWSATEQDGSTIKPNSYAADRSCCYTDVVETASDVATIFYTAPLDWNDDPTWGPWNMEQRNRFRIYAVDAKVEKK